MNAMTHRGYAARVEYSEDEGCFVGRIVGIRDVVGFHGDTVTRLRKAFGEAVDDYLETCERFGREPQQPRSAKLMLRVPSELHGAVSTAAGVSGKSLNQWATEALAEAVER